MSTPGGAKSSKTKVPGIKETPEIAVSRVFTPATKLSMEALIALKFTVKWAACTVCPVTMPVSVGLYGVVIMAII
jgi:hypothetical protein